MSSNRTSYGAARYINTYADWVYYTSAVGSWVVLQLPAAFGSGTAQLRMSAYSQANPSDLFQFSPAGLFTGGNLTTLPTATDAISIKMTSGSSTYALGCTTAQKYLNIMHSTDLLNTRIAMFQAGYCAFFMMIEKLKSPPANMATTDNWHIWCSLTGCGDVSDKPTIANMWSSSAFGFGGYSASSLVLAHYHMGPSVNAGHLGNRVTSPMPEQSVAGTTWPAWPIGISAYNVSGSPSFVYEERGQLYDIAWGCASQVTGSTYDSAGSKTWVKMGSLWLPWDGSTPMIS